MKKKIIAIVFTLSGVLLGYYISPVFYYVVGFRSDVRQLHLHLNTFEKGIQNDEYYLDDYDRQHILALRLEAAHLENMTLINLNELKRVKWLAQYLDRRAAHILAQIINRTKIYNDLKSLKEKYPDGKFISIDQFQSLIEEAQQKDIVWRRGLRHAVWSDNKGNPVAYTVGLRDYFLCDDRLVPCSFEEGVRKRYRINPGQSEKN